MICDDLFLPCNIYDLLWTNIMRPFAEFVVLCCRDEEFSVDTVSESDVIHANKKDIACIFRVAILSQQLSVF